MTSSMWLQVGLSLLGLIGITIGAYWTYRGTKEAKTIEAESTPYEKLADRVGILESQVDLLHELKWADRAFIRLLVLEWPDHEPLPLPMPGWVAEHFGVLPEDAFDRKVRRYRGGEEPDPATVTKEPPD